MVAAHAREEGRRLLQLAEADEAAAAHGAAAEGDEEGAAEAEAAGDPIEATEDGEGAAVSAAAALGAAHAVLVARAAEACRLCGACADGDGRASASARQVVATGGELLRCAQGLLADFSRLLLPETLKAARARDASVLSAVEELATIVAAVRGWQATPRPCGKGGDGCAARLRSHGRAARLRAHSPAARLAHTAVFRTLARS